MIRVTTRVVPSQLYRKDYVDSLMGGMSGPYDVSCTNNGYGVNEVGKAVGNVIAIEIQRAL